MPGLLAPGIHVFLAAKIKSKDVDASDKCGHDGVEPASFD